MSEAANEVIVPSSPEDRRKIRDAVKEMSNSYTKEQAEKDHRNTIIERIHEETGFDKKVFRRMAKDYYKNEFDKKVAEHENYEHAYEAILLTGANADKGVFGDDASDQLEDDATASTFDGLNDHLTYKDMPEA